MISLSLSLSLSLSVRITRCKHIITTMVSQSHPEIQSAIYKVLVSDPDVADLNSHPQQLNSLIVNLIKSIIDKDVKIYRVIVFDVLE